jgi:hypothetical protein
MPNQMLFKNFCFEEIPRVVQWIMTSQTDRSIVIYDEDFSVCDNAESVTRILPLKVYVFSDRDARYCTPVGLEPSHSLWRSNSLSRHDNEIRPLYI